MSTGERGPGWRTGNRKRKTLQVWLLVGGCTTESPLRSRFVWRRARPALVLSCGRAHIPPSLGEHCKGLHGCTEKGAPPPAGWVWLSTHKGCLRHGGAAVISAVWSEWVTAGWILQEYLDNYGSDNRIGSYQSSIKSKNRRQMDRFNFFM